jgi:hypothetical protein
MKTNRQLAWRGAEQTTEMGWWRVGQKQAGGRTKSNGDVELKRRRDLVMSTPQEGFPFMPPWDYNGHLKPSQVGAAKRCGGGNTGLDDGQPVRSRRRDRGRGKEMAERCHSVVQSWH